MKIVTVATHSERYFPVLQQSCKRHNIDLVILGWEQKWQGFNWRLHLLLDFLQTIPQDELVVFIDAYDVMILQDAKIIEDRYNKLIKKTGAKIIVGFEKAKSTFIELLALMVFGKCNKHRMNAGTYAGKAQDIYNMLKKACNEFSCSYNTKDNNDQVLFSKYCRVYPSELYIDEDNEIFLVINGALDHIDYKDEMKVINNKVIYKNKYDPCIIHAVGATNINNLIKQLGYDNVNPITLKDTIQYDITSIKHYSYFLRYYILVLFILGLILIIVSIIQQLKYKK